MTTITNNKLTDERVSNATLIRLIQWADQHNSHYVAAALCELQERRKADSAEPIGWTDAEELRSVEKDGCGYLFKANPISPNADPRRVIKLYRHAPPAPVMPETLPCSVELKPGLIIGKGCKTETLLTALKRRADFYAELNAMTPEEKAEYDKNIEAFKEMLPQPAPVVPEEMPMPKASMMNPIDAVEAIAEARGWNACRAAMLKGGAK
ncbi:hypothetical protein HQS73_000499 [Salmonella enterica]|nr:hypothetical protein [Salmonella enterica]EDT7834526.1 hypothetical protein [Salmonella enterica]EFR2060411.1 hypothetical protein [Salmonella enterica]EFV4528113.1 hypothetical protein [Salmonella enterica]